MMLGHMYIYILPQGCNYCFLGCCSAAENKAWGQWHSCGGLIPRCLEPPKTIILLNWNYITVQDTQIF